MIPALDDADLLFVICAVLPNLPILPDLPPILPEATPCVGLMLLLEFVLIREREAVDVKGADETTGGIAAEVADVAAGLDILLVLAAVATSIGGGTYTGTGALLSNKASGTLETDNAIEDPAYASLPLLSKVSNIVKLGNILNTFSL